MSLEEKNDIHKVRYFSSIITISNGKVTKVTTPGISHCPLVSFLNKELKGSRKFSKPRLKSEIKKVIENKIVRFGFCTKRRLLWDDGVSIPYGASEIIAHGLNNKAIDGAVVVCDGAGTVIATAPEVVQGIGARMHSVLITSPIPEVVERLQQYGCHVVSEDGKIDQVAGVIEAAKKGHKKIAVTINAYRGEKLKLIRSAKRRYKVSVIILMVCTTGIKKDRIDEIEKYADIVWVCRSQSIRDRLDKKEITKLSKISPVYVLTENGMKLVSGYGPNIYEIRKEMRKS